MNAFVALLILSPLQGPSFGMGGVEDFILTEKHAYMVLPPQAVGGPQTVRMSWSPSGRYLLMEQARPLMTPGIVSAVLSGTRPPKSNPAVSIWDKSANRITDLGSIPNHDGPFTWLAGKDVVLDIAIERLDDFGKERASLLRIDAAAGKLNYIPVSNPIPEGVFYQLFVSPVNPNAILLETKFTPRQAPMNYLVALNERGQFGQKVPVPPGNVGGVSWLQDGRGFFSMEPIKEPASYVVDQATGTISSAPEHVPHFRPKPIEQDLRVILAPMSSSAGTIKKQLNSAWLKSAKQMEQGEYFLAPRASMALLNATVDAVAVLDQGVVTVRLLAAVPMEMYLQAKASAEKLKALTEVKQIGTGAMIYAADNDDRLPTQEEFASGALQPYLKNNGLFDGFTYVFGGGSAKDIKNPSGTMLGYKPVAGGFAVVFADSSARWLKELPKNP